MRKLWSALLLGIALVLIVPPMNADEPRYNLGVMYDEVFPEVEQGATGESTIYFYSAFGNVTCWVTATTDNYPSGWRVEFDPENITVIPQWFENEPFDVGEDEVCLQLSYEDENGNPMQGWLRAYLMKVRVTVPKDTEPSSYGVKISYFGDFRMGGMSAVKRSGSIDWPVEVESGEPSALSSSNIFFIVAICAIAAGTVITIKLKRWGKKRRK